MTGSGTELDPYIIWDADDLQAVENDLAAWYELGCDIDASETETWNGGNGFLPIGEWINWGGVQPPSPYIGCAGVNWKQTPFTGHFDGKGYTISGLYIHRTRYEAPVVSCPGYYYIGLFGMLSDGAVVQNVVLSDASITGYRCVGALVGDSYTNAGNVKVVSCSVSGSISAEDDEAGGLAGSVDGYALESIIITGCLASVTVVGGDNYAGGLIGFSYLGVVSQSSATGSVTGGDCVGGLIGYAYGGTITNCRAICDLTTTKDTEGAVGGLIAYLQVGWTTALIEDCGAECIINVSPPATFTGYVGGFVGLVEAMDDCHVGIQRCYSNISISEPLCLMAGGFAGGISIPSGGNDSEIQIWECCSRGEIDALIYAGGFVGATDLSGEGLISLRNCYTRVNVTAQPFGGESCAGGFVGDSYSVESPLAYSDCFHCYSTGIVSGADNVGGFVARSEITQYASCFWDIKTSGQATSDGGTGKTTAEMTTTATFTSGGWDFVNIWLRYDDTNDGYPILVWQKGASSGNPGADVFTIPATGRIEVLCAIISMVNCTPGAKVTVRAYTNVHGAEDEICKQQFTKGADPDGIMVIAGNFGANEPIRFEMYSDNALDAAVDVPYKAVWRYLE